MKRLRELRQKKGLSQQALADMLHVTQQSVYKYENELAIPELDILIHMAEIFETSIDYLVGSTDVPFKYETYDADTSFTRSEMQVLNYYRRLSSNAKEFVQEIIQKGNEP